MQDELRARLGRESKRLLGGEPVRLRSSEGSACFLLSDCADADAGSLVRDPRHLQLVGGDSAPLVLDVDSLHPDGAQAASDAAFCTERLVCATRVLDAMLLSRYGIRVRWFSSGKQGVHGFAFGTSLSKPMRDVVAALLPGAESVFEHEAWASPAVVDAVESALRHLRTLDLSACEDEEWTDRLRAAAAPSAGRTTRLMAVTAFFDKGVTSSAQIRVPLAHNAKGCGYAGFPLPPTIGVQTRWPPPKRLASAPLVAEELDLLAALTLPTAAERQLTLQRLQADCQRPRKRALGETEERRLHNWVPRLHPRACALPLHAAARKALIPQPIRTRLAPAALAALEGGVCRGGAPPCAWTAEPDDGHRLEVSARGGGTGRADQPLALEALAGSNLTPKGRGDVARALFVSAFPVDSFAEAMKASPSVRRDVLPHWGSWFHTLAKGGAKVGAAAWRYDSGSLELVGVQCPVVLQQCARAARILTGRVGSGCASRAAPVGTSRRPAAANRDSTGRSVTLTLTGSLAEQLERARPAIQRRAEEEEGGARDASAVDHRLDQLLQRAKRDLETLHAAADNGIVTFQEYVGPEGRLGYACGGYCGVKAILRELRPIVFAGMWRVDLKRCHTSMLIGAHARAVSIGAVAEHPLLHRLYTKMESLEEELRADQLALLPAARARLDAARGTGDEENATAYVEYLQKEPKTLLSVMLNHPNKSPMFRSWPLAAACCQAMGVAAAAAKSHPLVAADRLRPQLDSGITPGSPAEKQRIAILLERRAVAATVGVLDAKGLAPSITINDEVLFAAPSGGADPLKECMREAVTATLGFDVRLSVGPL